MSTMLLAVDTARYEPGRHVNAAVEMVRDLASKTGDRVVVLHVDEFASGRFGRMQIDCADDQGEQLASGIVGDLHDAGIRPRQQSGKPTTGTSRVRFWLPPRSTTRESWCSGRAPRGICPALRSAASPPECCTCRSVRSSSCRCTPIIRSACQQSRKPQFSSLQLQQRLTSQAKDSPAA